MSGKETPSKELWSTGPTTPRERKTDRKKKQVKLAGQVQLAGLDEEERFPKLQQD
jgi:hypothetical protein